MKRIITAVALVALAAVPIAYASIDEGTGTAGTEQYPGDDLGFCHATASGFWILKTGPAAVAHRAHHAAGIGIHVNDREATQADVDKANSEPGNFCVGGWK